MAEELNQIPERKIKETGKMFKALKGAAGSAGPLGMVFKSLEVLSPILEAFEPILDAVGMLFEILAANIIPHIIEAMQPLMDAIMENSDLIAELGQAIGQILGAGLTFLVDILIQLSPLFAMFIEALIEILDAILPILIDMFNALAPSIKMIIELIIQVVEAILPVFMSIIMALMPFLEIIIGLIVQVVEAILPPILTVIEALMPIMIIIIEIIIELIEMILPILIQIFTALAPVIVAIINAIIPIIEAIMPSIIMIIEIIISVIEPLLPLIMVFADILVSMQPIFEILGGVVGWLIVVAMIPLIAAVYGVGLAIAALMDFFTLGLAGAVNSWNNLMLPILDTLIGAAAAGPQIAGGAAETKTGAGGGTISRSPEHGMQEFQYGGIAMSPVKGIVASHEPEIIAPLDPFTAQQKRQEALLEEIRDLTKAQIEYLEWRTR